MLYPACARSEQVPLLSLRWSSAFLFRKGGVGFLYKLYRQLAVCQAFLHGIPVYPEGMRRETDRGEDGLRLLPVLYLPVPAGPAGVGAVVAAGGAASGAEGNALIAEVIVIAQGRGREQRKTKKFVAN